jgi:hypothetical protein
MSVQQLRRLIPTRQSNEKTPEGLNLGVFDFDRPYAKAMPSTAGGAFRLKPPADGVEDCRCQV